VAYPPGCGQARPGVRAGVGGGAPARALRAGIVWIYDTQPAPTEAPWGRLRAVGIGRELGAHGIEDYLEAKHIYVNLA
jgi:acyl-CoA reductase-like NAD-dependent aldehyde dehydrogenase